MRIHRKKRKQNLVLVQKAEVLQFANGSIPQSDSKLDKRTCPYTSLIADKSQIHL